MDRFLLATVFYNNFEILVRTLSIYDSIFSPMDILVVDNSPKNENFDWCGLENSLQSKLIKIRNRRSVLQFNRLLFPSVDHWSGICVAQNYMKKNRKLYSRVIMTDPDVIPLSEKLKESLELWLNANSSKFISSTWSPLKARKMSGRSSVHFFYCYSDDFYEFNFSPSPYLRILTRYLQKMTPSIVSIRSFDPGWRIRLKYSDFVLQPAINEKKFRILCEKYVKISHRISSSIAPLTSKYHLLHLMGIVVLLEKYPNIVKEFTPLLENSSADILVDPDGVPWLLHGRTSQTLDPSVEKLSTIANEYFVEK